MTTVVCDELGDAVDLTCRVVLLQSVEVDCGSIRAPRGLEPIHRDTDWICAKARVA